MKLVDVRLSEVPTGSLVFPSRFAREAFGGGNYYCTERQSFMKDHQVFPAILLDPQSGKVTTPVGIQYLGGTAIVSIFSSR